MRSNKAMELKTCLETLKNRLQDIKDKIFLEENVIRLIKDENNKKILNFIKKNYEKKGFKDTFSYDIESNVERTVMDYFHGRPLLLNIYDVNNCVEEDFSFVSLQQNEEKIKFLKKKKICIDSWIEHVDYVYEIQKVNPKDRVLTLINLRLTEKEKAWGSGDYYVWLRSGIKALEWARVCVASS